MMSDSQKYIDEIIAALLDYRAVAMVGAGFSKNAVCTGDPNTKFLNWNELGNLLFQKLHGRPLCNDDGYFHDPMRLAQLVQITFGQNVLDALIRQACPDDQYDPGETHADFLRLPWRDVFTTNYDRLLERTDQKLYGESNYEPYTVILNPADLSEYKNDHRIIKLHGSFDSTRPFVLTEEEYRRYPEEKSTFVNTVQQALIEDVFVLIGFSGMDPNFLKWIGWVRDNLGSGAQRKMFLLSPHRVDSIEAQLLADRNIIPVDLDEFVTNVVAKDSLKDASATASPAKNSETELSEKPTVPYIYYEDFPAPDPANETTEIMRQFMHYLWGKVKGKQNKQPLWPAYSKISGVNFTSSLKDQTEWLKNVLSSYPGWAYIPPRARKNVEAYFSPLDVYTVERALSNKNEEGNFAFDSVEIVRYFYFLFKYADVFGEPVSKGQNDLASIAYKLLTGDIGTEEFPLIDWKAERKRLVENVPEGQKQEGKKAFQNMLLQGQYILLQLMRTFRERMDTEKVFNCNDLIRPKCFDNRNYNLYMAECCRLKLFTFEIGDDIRKEEGEDERNRLQNPLDLRRVQLVDVLRIWNPGTEDPYWSIIKASFYAYLGNTISCESLLKGALREIRKHIAMGDQSFRLQTLEEMAVNNLNMLKQAENPFTASGFGREAPTPNGQGSYQYEADWWSVQREYISILQKELPYADEVGTKYNFALRENYSRHFGNAEADRYTGALNYWRFLEDTGTVLRIGMVVNKEGMQESVRTLADYYPHWALVQTVLLGEAKFVNDLLGRKQLAMMDSEQVNFLVSKTINVIRSNRKNIPENIIYPGMDFFRELGYVLPAYLTRLCAKASDEKNREILNFLIDANKSGRLGSLHDLSGLFSQLIRNMTPADQAEYLEVLLEFPMEMNNPAMGYADPVMSFSKLDSKVIISDTAYQIQMDQIKKDEINDAELRRLIALEQLIVLKPEDSTFLYDQLEKRSEDIEYARLIVELKNDEQEELTQDEVLKFYDQSVNQLRSDAASRGTGSSGSGNEYLGLIRKLQYVPIDHIDFAEIFSLLNQIFINCEQDDGLRVDFENKKLRERRAVLVAELLLLRLNEKISSDSVKSADDISSISKEFEGAVNQFRKTVNAELGIQYGLEATAENMGFGFSDELTSSKVAVDSILWAMHDDDLREYQDFMLIALTNGYAISENLRQILVSSCNIIIKKLLSSTNGLLNDKFKCFMGLIQNVEFDAETYQLLNQKLGAIADETVIGWNDTEQEAILKTITRRNACVLAGSWDQKNTMSHTEYNSIDKWRNIHTSPEEMVEVRRAKFAGD